MMVGRDATYSSYREEEGMVVNKNISAEDRWRQHIRASVSRVNKARSLCREPKQDTAGEDSNGVQMEGNDAHGSYESWSLPNKYFHLASLLYELERMNDSMKQAMGNDVTFLEAHLKKENFCQESFIESLNGMRSLTEHQYLLMCSVMNRALEIISLGSSSGISSS